MVKEFVKKNLTVSASDPFQNATASEINSVGEVGK